MDKPKSCPLCDAIEADDKRTRHVFRCTDDPGKGAFDIRCDRCGRYRVSEEWLEDTTQDGQRPLQREVAIHLSFLAAQVVQPKTLVVTDKTYPDLMRAAPLETTGVQYFDRVIDFLASKSPYPGEPTPSASVRSYAARVGMPTRAFLAVATMLHTENVLEWADGNEATTSFVLKPEGWRRAEVVRRKGPLGNRAFVAMWFSSDVKEAYELGIKPALVAAGYAPPFRVDDAEHDSKHNDPDHRPRIDDRIIAELRRARFVVVDVTGARHSVYFEAGYAEALGLPLICCCRSDRQKEDMAFDTRQLPHILWTTPADLKQQLADRLERMGLVRS